jgi:hypothetical protein
MTAGRITRSSSLSGSWRPWRDGPFALMSAGRVWGAARRLLGRMPDGLADIIWLVLVLRIGLSLVGVFLFVGGNVPIPCNRDLVINNWITLPQLDNSGIAYPLVGVWQHWDACWYSKIAYHGYEAGVPSTTFFPLLPLLMTVGAKVLAGDVSLAGLVVNAIALVVGLFGLQRLVTMDFDRGTADRSVLYVAVFPVAFFFFAPFTEALFLAGAVWAVVGARRGNWLLVAGAAFVAGLARPIGLVLLLPLGWEALMALRAHWQASRRVGWRDALPFIASGAPAVAYLGYIAYTSAIGEPYVLAHNSFAGQSMNLRPPWVTIALAWDRIATTHDVITLLNLVALVLFVGLLLAGLRRLPVSYSLFVAGSMGLILTQDALYPLQSVTRYLMVLFPCFVVGAIAGGRPRFHTAWVLTSVLFLGLLTTLFLQGLFIA